MIKTESDPYPKIITGSFDGAEISGLFGIYIFIKLHDKNVGKKGKFIQRQ